MEIRGQRRFADAAGDGSNLNMSHAAVSHRMLDIGSLLGADRVRRPLGREIAIAETIVEPASIEEISELVRKCEIDRIALAPFGAGRTLSELRSRPVDLGISLKRLARVVAYEPEDMTIVATAGLTLDEVNRLCGERRQRLCVDPRNPALSTLGAIIGAAQAGPLRHSEGLVRDLLIGIQFVGHQGRVVRAGGRVVKNVAGYDLMKLMTGSFGTLGIVTEATFKIRPLPQFYAVALIKYPSMEAAFGAASQLHDTLPLTHLEVISPGHAESFGRSANYLMLAGFSGNRDELEHQRNKIAATVGAPTDFLENADAEEAYKRLRDLAPPTGALAAQVAVLPAALPRCLESIQRSLFDGANGSDPPRDSRLEFSAHVGAGVAEISVGRNLTADDASRVVGQWRAAAREAGGYLRVTAIGQGLRGDIPFFDSPNEGAMKLMRRLKASFDPAGIFNPGCFVGGI